MKRDARWIWATILLFLACPGFGAVNRYVDLNCPTPVSPYLTWTNAATTISGAVAVAEAGDTIWVTNGLYAVTAQIVVSNAIAIRSLNGPATVTVGRTDSAVTNRIFYVNSPGAVLDGLTIFNGLLYSGGGCGVYLNQGLLTNCLVVSNNFTKTIAQPPWIYGAGIYVNTGEIRNCTIAYNGSYSDNYSIGGGVYVQGFATIENCVIGLNKAQYGGGVGGNNITITNSRVWGNQSHDRAAGMYLSNGCQVVSCLIESNIMGGILYGSQAGIQIFGDMNTIRDCIILGNSRGGIRVDSSARDVLIELCEIRKNTEANAAVSLGAGCVATVRSCVIAGNDTFVGAAHCVAGVSLSGAGAVMDNCTIVANRATVSGGTWTRIGGLSIDNGAIFRNGIVVSNQASGSIALQVSNIYTGTSGVVEYTCSSTDLVHGVSGNITNSPMFVSWPVGYGIAATTGDLHLAKGSPCANAGLNQAWMTNTRDLDGRLRIGNGVVDMGAYEQPNAPGTLISVR